MLSATARPASGRPNADNRPPAAPVARLAALFKSSPCASISPAANERNIPGIPVVADTGAANNFACAVERSRSFANCSSLTC